jgi:hypothetical protein
VTSPGCQRYTREDLVDYAAGELPEADAEAVETHLFACPDCGARAMELDTLARGVARAVRSGELGGLTTDAVLNRLSREGVRVRTFALSPGAVVPCAVWDDDDLLVLRLRADVGGAASITLHQRLQGAEVSRETVDVTSNGQGELLFATPADEIRRLPASELGLELVAHEDGADRVVATYTLVHGGSFHR